MKREAVQSVAVFCLLVALGVATRWTSDAFQPNLSNFTATAAAAMFAGYFFQYRLTAALVPLTILVVSNYWLRPFEDFWQFAIVCIALLVPGAIGMLLRRNLRAWKVVVGSLSASISFFLITNFAEWAFYNLYPHTLSGVVDSYVAAIPFFERTLAGDLIFSGVIFGAYWLATTVTVGISRRRSCTVAAVADVKP